MDIRQLRYFLALAKHGSFSDAAARINIAQPSLSVQIAKLEEELGCRLVDRGGARGVRLTDAGRRLHGFAVDIVDRMTSARDEIIRDFGDTRLTVTLGIPPIMALSLAVPLIQAARELKPRVALRIVEGMSGTLTRQFAEGGLDLVILHNVAPTEFPCVLPLVHESLHLVGLPATLPKSAHLGIAELATLPLILPTSRNRLRQLLDMAAKRAGRQLNIAAENDSLPQLIGLVRGGLGCTVLPQIGIAGQADLASMPIVAEEASWCSSIILDRRALHNEGAIGLCRLAGAIVSDLIADGAWPGGRAADRSGWAGLLGQAPA